MIELACNFDSAQNGKLKLRWLKPYDPPKRVKLLGRNGRTVEAEVAGAVKDKMGVTMLNLVLDMDTLAAVVTA